MFETASNILSSQAPTRYAVRQILEQELHLTVARRDKEARQARMGGSQSLPRERRIVVSDESDRRILQQQKEDNTALQTGLETDFLSRVVEARPLQGFDPDSAERKLKPSIRYRKVWVTYHEGLNNAVRKPISLQDLMKGM